MTNWYNDKASRQDGQRVPTEPFYVSAIHGTPQLFQVRHEAVGGGELVDMFSTRNEAEALCERLNAQESGQ